MRECTAVRILANVARVSVVVLIVLLGLWALFVMFFYPTSTETGTTVTTWNNVPLERKAEVIATMKGEQGVFTASFEQRGHDISLSLMVMHPMSLNRAEHLAQTFMDRADQLARQYVFQYVENTAPSEPEPHRYSVRLFSMNDVFTIGATQEPEEITILEWKR